MNQQVHVFPVSAERPAPKRPNALPVVIVVVVAVLTWGLAAVNDKAGMPLVLALAGAWLVLLAWGLWILMRSVEHRRVRVDASSDRLTFVPRSRFVVALNVMPTGALVIWLVLLALLGTPTAGETFSSIPMRAALIGLPLVVIHHLWTLRAPRGLTLTPAGLTGVKYVTRVALTWDQISSVHVTELPGRGKVYLTAHSGRAMRTDAANIGSDAHAVATIVRHFMEHPEDRERLGEGAAVLAMFDAVPAAKSRR